MLDVTRWIARVACFLTVWVLISTSLRAADPESKAPPEEGAAIEKTVQELASVAKKSVVVVTFTGRDGQRQGLGSGFIISENGLIATNLHVIGEARPIQVELHDGRRFDVSAVHATERAQDLAILKIDATRLPFLQLGDSDELKEGQPVVAIGNPMGFERSVVSGILSGRRTIEGRSMLQIAMPIERGNSGGPLLDLQGKVHGLLTLKAMQTKNLGFAVAVNVLKPLIEKPNPIPMNRWLTIGAIDPDQWTVLPGARWRQRAGQIVVDGRGGGFGGRALCLATEPTPDVPFEVFVQVKFSPADGAAGLVFHGDGKDRHYGFYPSSGNMRLSRFDGPDVYSWAVLHEVRSPAYKKDAWNSLKVRVEAERFMCFLNGELVFESQDSSFRSGKVGLCKFRQTEAEFKGFQIGKKIEDRHPNDELVKRVVGTIDELSADDAADTKAIEQLTREDSSVLQALEQQARSLEDRAQRVRRLAAEVHVAKTLSEIRTVINSDSIDLLRGALLIAKLDNPELEVDNYVREVDRHAKRVSAMFPENADEAERLQSLNRYLFEEQGFHGSRSDSEIRSNSYLNEVIDDREGLPITLSVLYMEIAKRLGLNVVGVGMPIHFLARHEPLRGPEQLVDVFDRGRLLTRDEARKMYESLTDNPWQDSHLQSSSTRAILERILRNLLNQAFDAEDSERFLRYTEAVLLIVPDSGRDHFIHAFFCCETQRWRQAREEVEWLTTHESNIDPKEVNKLARRITQESQK